MRVTKGWLRQAWIRAASSEGQENRLGAITGLMEGPEKDGFEPVGDDPNRAGRKIRLDADFAIYLLQRSDDKAQAAAALQVGHMEDMEETHDRDLDLLRSQGLKPSHHGRVKSGDSSDD